MSVDKLETQQRLGDLKMKSWNVTTVNQPKHAEFALRVSAETYEEAMQLLTKDAFRGGYQINPAHIVSVVDAEQKFNEDKRTAMQIEEVVWQLEAIAKNLEPHSTQLEVVKGAIGDLVLAMQKLGF